MQIKIGYDITFQCPQPTPMMLMLKVHSTRMLDLVVPDHMQTDPVVDLHDYIDSFGNRCTRLVAPAGNLRVFSEGVVNDSGLAEVIDLSLPALPVEQLPDEVLVYLLGSRYCETDRLSNTAWNLFGNTPPTAQRVQTIVEYVHNHITFNYQNARNTRTAHEAWEERTGVCRDFTHLGVAFCRAMNIPARYCTGYLGDIGVPVAGPMDFAAWFEAYVGGQWLTFDPRNNMRRIGRIVIGRGRDAADVAINNSFGLHGLVNFTVVTDEMKASVAA